VDHGDAEQRPAPLAAATWTRDLGLGHVRIMLQRHGEQRSTRLVASADAGERNDRTDIAATATELLRLAGGIERFALHRTVAAMSVSRLSSRLSPVIGGKKAISRAPEWLRRSERGRVDGSADYLRVLERVGVFLAALAQQVTSSAIVGDDPPAGRFPPRGLPMRSRTQAK
jgi:hypothetical protein